MILAYHGHTHTEEELVQAFNTVPGLGTQPHHVVSGLQALGYHALWFERASMDRLKELLASEWPVIVFLRAQDLPYGQTGLHAVVLTGIREDRAIALDPTLDEELALDLTHFDEMWANLGRQGMVIWT